MSRGRCLGLVVVGLLSANAAHAQVARSQFNGTVTDSAGGVLVGAVVIATNVETNVASKTTTTEAGVYVIPYLANGLYRIRVEATGFRPAQSEQITLRAAQTLTLDFKLNVDALTEALTVTAPVIETSTAEIGHYVSSKEYQTWPIAVGDGQRQVQQFIFSSLPGSTGGTFEGAINGGRNYSHEILVEGIPLGRNLQGGSNNEMSPPTEMVGEFKLQTGTLGAEFGGGQTAVANFVVKSGTNDFHGSGAFYLQDSSMDARPFQAKALDQNLPIRETQNWAVAVGGPIMLPKYNGKNRSFFYASFEKTHAEDQTSTSFRTLPTREFQNGDFSRLFDAAYTGDPLLGNGGWHRRARPVRALRPDLRSAHDARRRRPGDAGSVPEQSDSARHVGRGRAQHARSGTVGCAGTGSAVEQPAAAQRLLPDLRSEDVRDEVRPGAERQDTSCRSTSIANGANGTTPLPAATARRPDRPPICTSCRARRAG